MRDRDRDAQCGSDSFDELLDLDVVLVGDQVGLAVADLGRHGRDECVDEVVDVERVVQRPAVAEHRKDAARDALEDHEEPLGVAGAVDGGRPQDRRAQAGGGSTRAKRTARPRTSLLVVVGRLDRRVLVGGRIVDVAMHAAGAAVDDFLDAGASGGVSTLRVPSTLTS